MNYESYCARMIKITEGENFLSVGDEKLERYIQLKSGIRENGVQKLSLPDLLSQTQMGQVTFFRLREVKFKLEERLVLKAIRQLQVGVRELKKLFEVVAIDRLEIVIPLLERKLKADESCFLGSALDANRYLLKLDRLTPQIQAWDLDVPISVLLL